MFDKYLLKYRSKVKAKSPVDVKNKNTTIWIPLALMVPSLIFLILFTFIPFITAFADSLGTPENYSNYFENLWQDSNWLYATKNSFLYALMALPLTLIIALFVSMSISNLVRKRSRGSWQTVFFLPYVTSTIAISITFAYLLNSEYGLINQALGIEYGWLITKASQGNAGLFAMVIYGVWSGLAFNILILTTAMLSVDKRLYDAASIDGSGTVKQFTKVTLPSIQTTIWYLITVGLIASIKIFPLALFDSNPDLALQNGPTMLVYIYDKVQKGNYGLAGAASVSLLFLSIAFNLLVVWTIKGIQKSSKKGSEVYSSRKIDRHKTQIEENQKQLALLNKIKKGDDADPREGGEK